MTLAAFDNVSNEVQPSATGRFKITYENKGLSSTRIGFYGLTYSFVHDENSKIRLTIDQARINIPKNRKTGKLKGDNLRDSVKQAATISIEGDFAEINRFSNRMARTSTVAFRVEGCDYSKLIRQAERPSEAISILDSLTQIELDQIAMLATALKLENMNSRSVTPELKRFLEIQVRSFYGTVFLSGMMLKRFDQAQLLSKNPQAPDTIYNREWEQVIETFMTTASKRISPLAASFEYNEFILSSGYTLENYRKYDFEAAKTSDDELVVERLLQPQLTTLDSLHIVDDKAILAYRIHNLSRFLYTQTFYSPVLLNAVNTLKEKYPDSQLLKPYEPKIDLLKTYLRNTSKHYQKSKIVETNFLHFNDLLETFKGKNLLIDIWATWCAPCVDDFNYKSILKPFIEDGSIAVLYISIDKPQWERKWKENIKFNELEGYHVLADNLLIQDMWKQLGGTAGLIPRYALIDKNGSVYLNNAARPSEGAELVNQIRGLLGTE
ncbi:MAG: TlpA disulfide reductase family protein [Cyclobacteriaceae bacterium]